MNATPTLLAAALLVLPGLAAAEHEEGYYVQVENPPPEAPAERDSRYDCASGDRPDDVQESIAHNADEVLGGGERWGLPYVAPDCLAFDSTVPPPPVQPVSTCSRMSDFTGTAGKNRIVRCNGARSTMTTLPGLGLLPPMAAPPPADAYWSYNLSTGRYTVHVEPGNHTFQGNTGFAVNIDCEECDPPGFSIPPDIPPG